MQTIVSSLMAVVLTVHPAVGCCWHHAHACTAVAAEGATCCNHHYHDQATEQPQQPCECKVECEGTCQYVAPEEVRLDDLRHVEWMAFVAPTATFADSAPSILARDGEWCRPIDSGPPLRLHLLHQLLLI